MEVTYHIDTVISSPGTHTGWSKPGTVPYNQPYTMPETVPVTYPYGTGLPYSPYKDSSVEKAYDHYITYTSSKYDTADDDNEVELQVSKKRDASGTVVYEVAVPGYSSDQVKVDITDSKITIQLSEDESEFVSDYDYEDDVILRGEHTHVIELDEELDASTTTAVLDKGIIYITVQKKQGTKVNLTDKNKREKIA